MRTCIIIPTYNEAKTIGELIRQIRAQGLEVIAIDDGSEDKTSKIAQDSGAAVLQNPKNEGKGEAIARGFGYALGEGFDAVITMDGDGQHLAEDIPYFLRLAEYSNSGMFIGNRMSKAQCMPWVRFVTNKFMSWLLSRITRQNIPDSQCGFRLIKREVLEKIKLMTSKYETESEILIEASRLGYKIESVPIKTVYKGEKSRINPLWDTVRFIRLIIKEILGKSYLARINTDRKTD